MTLSVPTPPRRLPQVHEVARHPRDGWSLAEPCALSRSSERALHGVIRALLPPPPAPRPADMEARMARQVRCMMQYMPTALRLGMALLLNVLEWSPVWRLRALSRLSSLSARDASQVLSKIAQSRLLPLRMMLLAPKAIVLSAYFDQDEVHAALDYEPRAFIRERIAAREAWLAQESSGAHPTVNRVEAAQ